MPVNIGENRIIAEGIARIRIADAERLKRYRLRTGDIVYSRRGDIEKCALVRQAQDGWLCGTGCLRVRLGNGTDPRFVSYYLADDKAKAWLVGRAVGATMPNLNTAILSDLPICCPPLVAQHAIVEVLGALDDKVELNRRMSATLEELARSLFASSFGVLDPEGLPDGWTVGSLAEHVEVTRGLSYSGAGLSDAGIPLQNLDSIYEGGGYKYHGVKHYRGDYKDRHVVRGGDLLVANTEQGFDHLLIGFPALVPKRFGDLSLVSHHLYRVRPKAGSLVTARFLYLALMSPRLRQVAVGYSNGTTVNMLPADALQRPRLAIPPTDVVQRFDGIVAPFFARQEQLQLESETLVRLRDVLLPKLMSGEIRLNEAEKAVVETL
jgi:type I restriction enzyme, S subunit